VPQQRLGSISLKRDPSLLDQLDLFAWCSTAARAAASANADLASLTAKLATHQTEVQKLQTQLDDLVTAKTHHETELLAKFAQLLNAKKVKIRDQQRLLAAAKLDRGTATAVEASRANGARRAGVSRTGKRKAAAPAREDAVENVSDDESDGFDGMDVDIPARKEAGEEDDRATPERSDLDKTEDEDEEPRVVQARKKGVGARGKVLERDMSDGGDGVPPPRRELPFAKRKTRSQLAEDPEPEEKAKAAADEQEEEETDDEL